MLALSMAKALGAASVLLAFAQGNAADQGSSLQCDDPATAEQLERASHNTELNIVDGDGDIKLTVTNLRHIASEILLTGKNKEEGRSEAVVVPPLSTTEIMSVEAETKEAALEFLNENWRFRSYMGDPEQVSPDFNYLYRLPFRSGATYPLTQGFNGKRSHQSIPSLYALDFQLEVGDAVHAARDGKVVRAVDWFCRSGGREMISQVNLVVIEHSDGTMAHYVHLDHKSVFVEEGDRVERGQHIANVGMTGFTGGPHLHFVVRRERDIAIPIAFEGYEGRDLSRKGRFTAP